MYTGAVLVELELAVRFLRRRRTPLLRGTALAAFSATILATASLVVTLALMSGYRGAIGEALGAGNGHMVVFSAVPLDREEAVRRADAFAAVSGVVQAVPVSYVSALLRDPAHPSSPAPVVVKAAESPPAFTGLKAWPAVRRGLPPAVVGGRLAESLGLERGSALDVSLPPEAGSWVLPALRFEMRDTFRLAFAEFDERWLVVPLAAILDARPEIGVAGVELMVADPLGLDAVRERVDALYDGDLITDWREMNAPLFAALEWQTWSLFLVLSLVVAVASFQVSSALVVLAVDKRRSTGMLQALGATRGSVWRVLFAAGTLLGAAAVAAGLVLGAAASWVLSALRVIRFPQGLAHVYMVDFIPLELGAGELSAVAGTCLLLVILAAAWPAWSASRVEPVAALRSV